MDPVHRLPCGPPPVFEDEFYQRGLNKFVVRLWDPYILHFFFIQQPFISYLHTTEKFQKL